MLFTFISILQRVFFLLDGPQNEVYTIPFLKEPLTLLPFTAGVSTWPFKNDHVHLYLSPLNHDIDTISMGLKI